MAVETDERARAEGAAASETEAAPEEDEERRQPGGALAPTLALASVLGLAAAGLAAFLARRGRTESGDDEPATSDVAEAESGDAEHDAEPADAPEAASGEGQEEPPAAAGDEAPDEPQAQRGDEDEDAPPKAAGDEETDEGDAARAATVAGEQRDDDDGDEGGTPGPESAAEEDSDPETDRADEPDGQHDGRGSGGGAAEVARHARQRIEELTGRRPESISAIERVDDGWHVAIELVEVERIPSTTDVIASYELVLDEDGEVLRYARGRRYHRGQADAEGDE